MRGKPSTIRTPGGHIVSGSISMWRVGDDGTLHQVAATPAGRMSKRFLHALGGRGLDLARPRMKDRAARRRAGHTRTGGQR